MVPERVMSAATPASTCAPAADPLAAYMQFTTLQGRAVNTTYNRQRVLTRLAGALPVPLADATAGQLYDWRSGLGVSNATAAGYLSHVQEFYRWLVRTGQRADDPSAGLPVPKVPRRLPHPIGEADLEHALETAPGRIRLWLVLAGWAGLRAFDISGLRIEDIILDAANPVLILITKGGNERAVPLCGFAVTEVRAAGLPARGWVAPRRDGKPGHTSAGLVSRLCNEHLHDCGITATLHKLRHRFLTEAYRESQDLLAVQELAGHASPATTAPYVKVAGTRGAAIVNALPVPGATRKDGQP
jgi:site-specific recombinase XerC